MHAMEQARLRAEHALAAAIGGAPPALGAPSGLLEVLRAKEKTELCKNFEAGSCRFGERCSYAHGLHELRSKASNGPHVGPAPPAMHGLSLPAPLSDTVTNAPSGS